MSPKNLTGLSKTKSQRRENEHCFTPDQTHCHAGTEILVLKSPDMGINCNSLPMGGPGDVWTVVGVFAPSREAEAEPSQSSYLELTLQRMWERDVCTGIFSILAKILLSGGSAGALLVVWLGWSLPAACWVCRRASKMDGHCVLCSSCHLFSKAISRMLLYADILLQSQGNKGLTSGGSCVASVKDV